MLKELLLEATVETLYMILVSGLVTALIGGLIGVLLFALKPGQILGHAKIYWILSAVINIGRSFPFIILMLAITPFTRMLVGSSIGTNAAIVALTIAAIPFFARVMQSALEEVPSGLLDAARVMGANKIQTLWYVALPEAVPNLINGITLTLINLVGYSAMAGAIGGGGLGTLAINYGHQRFDVQVMTATVMVLIVIVQLIQLTGDFWYRRFTCQSKGN